MNIILIFYLIFIIFSIHINGETKINLNKKYQVIDGFGASSAWQGEVSDKIMDNLFNKAGLSILRIRISDHKEISWDGWQVELSNAKKALKYNALVFASPWKPGNNLADMSLSKSGTIPSNKYNDYADYLQSFVNYMKQNGAPLYAISLQNEPDCASTDWTPQQMVNFLKSSAKRITGVKIMAPESTGFSQQFSEAILNDHEAASKVDIIAGHIYNIVIVNQTRAQEMGKHLWMTEFYTSGKDWKSVIELAKSIHNCINIAQFNAYVHWWFNDNSPNMMLIDSNGELTPKAYVMGQFSKFIKRGYVRIDTNSDNNNILISGYIGGQNKLVIVAINIGYNSINQQFSINGGSALYTSLTPYITSQGKNLEKQLNIKLNGGKFTYSIPGQSIVTFVNE